MMDISVETDKLATLVVPQIPHIDESNHDLFMERLGEVLSKHHHVVLDLESLNFLDSSGLGALAYCYRFATNRGGTVRLCNPSTEIQVAFDLIHMERVVPIHESREAAMNAAQQAAITSAR